MQKGDKSSDDYQCINFFDELVCDVYLCVRRKQVCKRRMKPYLTLLLVLLISSCGGELDTSKNLWKNYEKNFEDIVVLVKVDKLKKIYGRMGYEIPDSFPMKATCGDIVFRETDFTYDSSFSILFRVGFDSSNLARTYPTIVYTDNAKRIKEYNSKQEQVTKLKNNWYLLSRL